MKRFVGGAKNFKFLIPLTILTLRLPRVYGVYVLSLSCVRLFATPWSVTHQVPLSMGFFRQEY